MQASSHIKHAHPYFQSHSINPINSHLILLFPNGFLHSARTITTKTTPAVPHLETKSKTTLAKKSLSSENTSLHSALVSEQDFFFFFFPNVPS